MKNGSRTIFNFAEWQKYQYALSQFVSKLQAMNHYLVRTNAVRRLQIFKNVAPVDTVTPKKTGAAIQENVSRADV